MKKTILILLLVVSLTGCGTNRPQAVQPFPLPDNTRPTLVMTTPDDEAQKVMEWKLEHETWKVLEILWQRRTP